MAINAAQAQVKTVADPCAAYESLQLLWRRSRAVCRGEKYVKEFDYRVEPNCQANLLIPFSPSMTDEQYWFYKAEAELPGICSQYAKTMIGGLLRKQPTINFPEDMDKAKAEEAADWIIHQFGQDGSPLAAFLDEALWEEVQTSRAWIIVDYPDIDEKELDEMDQDDRDAIKPYPILYPAEAIINWRTATDKYGCTVLDRLIIKGFTEEYDDEEYEFHPKLIPTVWVHELKNGLYQVRIYKRTSEPVQVAVVNGDRQVNNADKALYELEKTVPVFVNDEQLDMIPAWPLNGCIEPNEPMLTAIVDKELALYNKVSRRNHLMYGAATYTPWIKTNSDEAFEEIVNSGLGTWIQLPEGESDAIGVLETPVAALEYMENSIAAAIEEMAKLGIRMLTPKTDQSGVALELRNAAQTAQLGSLNNKVSNTLRQVIAFMVNWRYELELEPNDIDFTLSSDFNPIPVGADWLRLATEWYENGQIPRSLWLLILQKNDMIPPDYNDEEGQEEINDNEMVVPPAQQHKDEMEIAAAKIGGDKPPPPKPGVK
jgi:hypothetical protein